MPSIGFKLSQREVPDIPFEEEYAEPTEYIMVPFGKVFGDISLSFVDINFTMDFYMILRCFLLDFDTLWTSKNEHFAWRVLQKSTFVLFDEVAT